MASPTSAPTPAPAPAATTSRPRTVAVTGATGFVGRYIVAELLQRGHTVRALVRSRDKAREVLPAASTGATGAPAGILEVVAGDALDAAAPRDLVRGCDACVHLIGIIRQAPGGISFQQAHPGTTRAMLEACKHAGVERFVHMSALGVGPEGRSKYQKTKWEAEQLVRASGLSWTIFRPGLIHGLGSSFVEMAADWVSGDAAPYLFLPYFKRVRNDRDYPTGRDIVEDPRVQPVHVADVARAFAEALDRTDAVGEVYPLVGPEVLTWPEMLTYMRDRLPGARAGVQPFGVPAVVAAASAKAAELVGLHHFLPFDEGMAIMGGEDSVGNPGKARADLGVEPRAFRASFAEYAAAV